MKNYIKHSLLIAAVAMAGLAMAADKDTKGNPPAGKTDSTQVSAPAPTKIDWHRYSEGLALAKKLNKKVFIEFTAKWCGWCKKMQATTFKEPEVISLIDKYYVPVTVDGDSRDTLNIEGWITTEASLTRETFGVNSYPIFWFLTSTGDRIAPLVGYRDKDVMVDVLDYLKDEQYKTVTFDTYLQNKRKKN